MYANTSRFTQPRGHFIGYDIQYAFDHMQQLRV